jgi:hypothetical protein
MEATPAIRAELYGGSVEKTSKKFPEFFPAFLAAQGIDMENNTCQPKAFKKKPKHKHHFGVQHRIIYTEGFGINLIELPVSPFLRAFVAEHGANGV